jgi:L-ascorbate metabolism protein UlaG (beta-lactamase superfamily)
VARARCRRATRSERDRLPWYGHAAFVVKTPGGTVLAIDPAFTDAQGESHPAETRSAS